MFIPSFSDSMSVEDIDKRIKDSRERIRTLNLDIPYLESRKIFAHQKVLDARSVSHLTNEDNWDEYYRQLSLREEELRRAEDELKAATDKLYDEQKYLNALEEHRKKIWAKEKQKPAQPTRKPTQTPQTDQENTNREFTFKEEVFIRYILLLGFASLINIVRICKKIWRIGCFSWEHWLATGIFCLIFLFAYLLFANVEIKKKQLKEKKAGKILFYLLLAAAAFGFYHTTKVEYLQGWNIFKLFYSMSMRVFIFIFPFILMELIEVPLLFFMQLKKNAKENFKILLIGIAIAAGLFGLGILFKGMNWCLAELREIPGIFHGFFGIFKSIIFG